MTDCGAKFSLAIISSVLSCRFNSAAIARYTCGSTSASPKPSVGLADTGAGAAPLIR